jgi:hypothetical protein
MEEKAALELARICEVFANRLSEARVCIGKTRHILLETHSSYLIETAVQKNIDETVEILRSLLDWNETRELPEDPGKHLDEIVKGEDD